MGENIKQHTVAKSILKRFTRNGTLEVVIKSTGAIYATTPKDESRVKNYLTLHKVELENKFAAIETGLPALFSALDENRPLTETEKQIAKTAIALHALRSKRTKDIWNELAEDMFRKTGEKMKDNPQEFINTMEKSLGRPVEPEDMRQLVNYIDGITEEYIRNRGKGKFDEFFMDMYEKFVEFMTDATVEVGIASGSKTFVLPDTGTLLRDHPANKNGFREGVKLTEANVMWLPFGPRHLISIVKGKHLGKRPDQSTLTDTVVEKMNQIMVADAETKFYRQPSR